MTQWVNKVYEEIPATLIVNSFKSCGISNALDATQNDAIWEEDESERNDEIE